MNNQDYAIFVSSSDNYSDLWPVFFDMFHRFWPNYSGKIYLQTQEKEFSYHGLNIQCTKVGKLPAFGYTMHEGLNRVKEEYILFMMVDYMFMGDVDATRINEYFEHFLKENLDVLFLCYQKWQRSKASRHKDLKRFLPPSNKILFSYQIAFWKKSVLKTIIQPHEDPWMSEYYGDERAEKMNIWAECINKDFFQPIPYDGRGCLHQGKWLDNAVEFLQGSKYIIDFSKRGYYSHDEGYGSLSSRIKIKISLIKCWLKGSYLAYLKTKPIH